MACEEMQLYYAYLDAIEAEERRKAQPWQCEVTVIAPADQAPNVGPPAAEPSAAPQALAPAKAGFVCDTPE
jgi:hypothetical protein